MKNRINNILRKFGAEIHGTGYLQALAKGEFKKDAFAMQQEIAGAQVQIVFDIGANRGDVAEYYQAIFPQATVFAFEPFPESFNILKERFSNNNRVKCFQYAVAADATPKTFYVNKNVDTNSLLKPKATGLSSDVQVSNQSIIEVPCVTLDEFCAEKNINSIDILKMDIQGGEFDALKGAAGLLERQSIGLIYSETYFVEQYESQPLFHDISKLLFGYRYALQDIYNPIYGKGSIAWADVIFKKAIK
jgi:FkbM family methyltransferase